MINISANRAVEAMHFQLYKRAKHVLTEARRVLQFRRACMEAETEHRQRRLGGCADKQPRAPNERLAGKLRGAVRVLVPRVKTTSRASRVRRARMVAA